MRKSQAALEFLTTYAWAFIVISITIGALYYFGILDFSKYLPQKCIFPSQFKCLEFSLRPSEVRLKLVNNLGEDICVKSVGITSDAAIPVSCTFSALPRGACGPTEFEWKHDTTKDLFFTSCFGGGYLSDTRVEVKILMNYYAINTPSKPIHAISGKIDGRVTTS